MAALTILAFTFFTVTFLRGGFCVTDEEFQEISRRLKIQEVKNERQATVISQQGEMISKQGIVINQQGEVISRLEALITSDRKYKPEVQEAGSIQNATIEDRVSLLELQVADLDQDVNFLFDEQVIQDERLLELEQFSDGVVVELAEINVELLDLNFRVTDLEENGGSNGNNSVAELEVRVQTLEGTAADHETRISAAESDTEATETRLIAAEENIQGLQTTDINHDARISALEENGGYQNDTIAFHTALTSYDTIPVLTPVIFNEVLLNEGKGYDNTTGVFTVPPGGDGFYYFSTYVLVDDGEYAGFDIRLNNDDTICTTRPDHDAISDYAPGSCSAVVSVMAGDQVAVLFDTGSDTTPLRESSVDLFSGFNGFRI